MSGHSTPRVRIPRSARSGEGIEIRTSIEHPMETGPRMEGARAVPRDTLARLLVGMNGETVFAAGVCNGTSANPYYVIFVRMERTASSNSPGRMSADVLPARMSASA
ncbi:thiosulfate oxidation carrier complex protein SoxZ [Roseomonas sp. JC162]|uniref:Thiosulfate oxidation carrier complex protein SoxZ n=1 Tax=Neoroseomonas marina TaxID=1232220 RepID=A0A848EJA2_9PROT|nr:thiosulfate oxidation carrier complex protein SoxZ [Neoroseomonas marina]